ncbi:ribosome maturation factor RimP [Clostridiaceae bacterium OttesenSCG-928-D20]|nr:ribosome maturation factor RimP [Clostridiaceae bacterium OttesenSCG-928-D20]
MEKDIKPMRTVDKIRLLAEPVCAENSVELWDVEYVKEAGGYYLRLYIDKTGGISISDCEAVSRAMDKLLDEHDPIENAYTFEVSSAGAERVLKTDEHFQRFIGEYIEVKLYKAIDGKKSFLGELISYGDNTLKLSQGDIEIEFEKSQIAQVRLRII